MNAMISLNHVLHINIKAAKTWPMSIMLYILNWLSFPIFSVNGHN